MAKGWDINQRPSSSPQSMTQTSYKSTLTMDFSFSTIAISLLVLFILAKLFFNSSKKNYPPSPRSLPIIGHLHLFKKPLHQCLARLSQRYGPIFFLRFGSRPVLVVSSPALAEECLTKNDVIFANRPKFTSNKHLSYNYTTLGMSNYGPHWKNIRRIASVEILSSQRINSFADVRVSELGAMIRRLLNESAKAHFARVDLKSRLFGFSLNNMMRMIAGKRYYDVVDDEGADSAYSATKFIETVEEVFSLSGASNIGDFLPFVGWMDLQGIRKRTKELARYRDELMQKLIDERRNLINSTDQKDETMIGQLLYMQKKDPEYYTDPIIKGLVIALLGAGTDTSSDTIQWAMAVLLNNPDKLKKAQAEIDERVGNGRLMKESDLANLPYLQSVITETLRLYPAGTLLVPHESSEECVVGGYYIPKGTMLLINAYKIQRDPEIWESPTKFEPERFQVPNKGENKLQMLPFGMGRRRCPGEGLANRVVGLVLGTMIQCFDWKRVSDELVDMTEGSGLTMPRAIPLEAMYRPREAMTNVLSGLL